MFTFAYPTIFDISLQELGCDTRSLYQSMSSAALHSLISLSQLQVYQVEDYLASMKIPLSPVMALMWDEIRDRGVELPLFRSSLKVP